MNPITRKAIVIAISLWMSVFAISADNNDNNRMPREQFAELQAKQMASELKLDEETSRQLIDTYCKCQKELWKIGPKSPHRFKKGEARKNNKKELSEEEARRELTGRFEHWRKFNDIQEKYYKEYSKFLTQVQILKLYDLERQQMERMRRQGKKRPSQR